MAERVVHHDTDKRITVADDGRERIEYADGRLPLEERVAALETIIAAKGVATTAEITAEAAKRYVVFKGEVVEVPTVAAWQQPAGAHDAYQAGDRVMFNDTLFESLIDANVWAPNVTGWRAVTS